MPLNYIEICVRRRFFCVLCLSASLSLSIGAFFYVKKKKTVEKKANKQTLPTDNAGELYILHPTMN